MFLRDLFGSTCCTKPLLSVLTIVVSLSVCGCAEKKSYEEILIALKNSGATIGHNSDREVISIEYDLENQVDDEFLKNLKGLSKLEKLNLNFSTKVTDAGLKHLRGLTNLREMYLSHVQGVTDAGLVHLKGLSNLERLSLTGTRTSDAGLEHLKGLSKLRSLSLSETQVTDSGVQQLKQALPNCLIER